MASGASGERARPTRVNAGLLPEMHEVLEGEHSSTTESGSEMDSSTSAGRLLQELARAPPGADLDAIAQAFWASPHRSMNRPFASSQAPTADVLPPLDPQIAAFMGDPIQLGAPAGNYLFQSPGIMEGLTGVRQQRHQQHQQQQSDASSNVARLEASTRSRVESSVTASGRAVDGSERSLGPL
eukprot:TRINITY_DN8153_c0_g2_i1.p1 TRINITY_DN8153_c0_g2~~TRINITY_DN8153_c0_g2_i1.p1  ORF type:complete len:183 (+),score=27.52 TRINITY_DN8153_c0_g2_i1:74-622(+)